MNYADAGFPGYEEFRIKYDGIGIRDGQIDARDLAESLLALTSLLERSNKIINGKDSEIAVKVRANMQPGSFIVNIVNFFTKVGELGASQTAAGWVNVTVLVGVVGTVVFGAVRGSKSLFRILKEARGRNVTQKIPQTDGSIKAILDDGSEVDGLSQEVLSLYDDIAIRHSVESMSQILKSDSITSMEFFGNAIDIPVETITKEDLTSFEAPASGILLENKVEKILIISTASIEGESSGWRFKEDAESHDFVANVLDESFLEKIRSRKITLGRGDMIRVKLLTEQRRPRMNLKTTYTVLQVLDYIPYEEAPDEGLE